MVYKIEFYAYLPKIWIRILFFFKLSRIWIRRKKIGSSSLRLPLNFLSVFSIMVLWECRCVSCFLGFPCSIYTKGIHIFWVGGGGDWSQCMISKKLGIDNFWRKFTDSATCMRQRGTATSPSWPPTCTPLPTLSMYWKNR